jgi:eukaryotic-like serine/threonine-protein kinase
VLPPVGRSEAPPPRRGRAAALVAALVAAALIAGLIVALLLTGGSGNSPQAGQTTTSSAPLSSRDSTPVTSSTAPSTPSASSTEQQSNGTGNGNGNGGGGGGKGDAPTADQLAQAITDYYDLLPGDTDQAWDRLTKRYQDGTARSREYFQSFWDQIASVSTSDVTGTAPDSVKATITYTYSDGRVVVERTAFTLVRQGGILKIDSSEVLDSQTQ